MKLALPLTFVGFSLFIVPCTVNFTVCKARVSLILPQALEGILGFITLAQLSNMLLAILKVCNNIR